MNGVASNPDAFLTKLDELPELRPFPATAARLIAECKNPDVSPRCVAETASCDAVLAARLLKIANSPLHGYAGKIRSIEHCVVVLGMSAIRNLSMAMAGAELFSEGESAVAQRKQLWRHSLQVAVVARQLAGRCRDVAEDEAFLAGIFHDVGKLVFYDLEGEAYLQLDQRGEELDRVAAERQSFGIDHAELGMDCADTWGLPAEIATAIGHHHDAESARSEGPLAAATRLANFLAQQWQIGGNEAREDELTEAMQEAIQEAIEQSGLEIDVSSLEEIRTAAAADFEETEKAYSM